MVGSAKVFCVLLLALAASLAAQTESMVTAQELTDMNEDYTSESKVSQDLGEGLGQSESSNNEWYRVPYFVMEYQSMPAGSVEMEQCRKECQTRPECRSFSWNTKTKACLWSLSSIHFDSEFDFFAKTNPERGAPFAYDEFVGVKYQEDNGRSTQLRGLSKQECRGKCDTDDTCVSFSYKNTGSVCYLSKEGLHYDSQWIYFEKTPGMIDAKWTYGSANEVLAKKAYVPPPAAPVKVMVTKPAEVAADLYAKKAEEAATAANIASTRATEASEVQAAALDAKKAADAAAKAADLTATETTSLKAKRDAQTAEVASKKAIADAAAAAKVAAGANAAIKALANEVAELAVKAASSAAVAEVKSSLVVSLDNFATAKTASLVATMKLQNLQALAIEAAASVVKLPDDAVVQENAKKVGAATAEATKAKEESAAAVIEIRSKTREKEVEEKAEVTKATELASKASTETANKIAATAEQKKMAASKAFAEASSASAKAEAAIKLAEVTAQADAAEKNKALSAENEEKATAKKAQQDAKEGGAKDIATNAEKDTKTASVEKDKAITRQNELAGKAQAARDATAAAEKVKAEAQSVADELRKKRDASVVASEVASKLVLDLARVARETEVSSENSAKGLAAARTAIETKVASENVATMEVRSKKAIQDLAAADNKENISKKQMEDEKRAAKVAIDEKRKQELETSILESIGLKKAQEEIKSKENVLESKDQEMNEKKAAAKKSADALIAKKIEEQSVEKGAANLRATEQADAELSGKASLQAKAVATATKATKSTTDIVSAMTQGIALKDARDVADEIDSKKSAAEANAVELGEKLKEKKIKEEKLKQGEIMSKAEQVDLAKVAVETTIKGAAKKKQDDDAELQLAELRTKEADTKSLVANKEELTLKSNLANAKITVEKEWIAHKELTKKNDDKTLELEKEKWSAKVVAKENEFKAAKSKADADAAVFEKKSKVLEGLKKEAADADAVQKAKTDGDAKRAADADGASARDASNLSIAIAKLKEVEAVLEAAKAASDVAEKNLQLEKTKMDQAQRAGAALGADKAKLLEATKALEKSKLDEAAKRLTIKLAEARSNAMGLAVKEAGEKTLSTNDPAIKMLAEQNLAKALEAATTSATSIVIAKEENKASEVRLANSTAFLDSEAERLEKAQAMAEGMNNDTVRYGTAVASEKQAKANAVTATNEEKVWKDKIEKINQDAVAAEALKLKTEAINKLALRAAQAETQQKKETIAEANKVAGVAEAAKAKTDADAEIQGKKLQKDQEILDGKNEALKKQNIEELAEKLKTSDLDVAKAKKREQQVATNMEGAAMAAKKLQVAASMATIKELSEKDATQLELRESKAAETQAIQTKENVDKSVARQKAKDASIAEELRSKSSAEAISKKEKAEVQELEDKKQATLKSDEVTRQEKSNKAEGVAVEAKRKAEVNKAVQEKLAQDEEKKTKEDMKAADLLRAAKEASLSAETASKAAAATLDASNKALADAKAASESATAAQNQAEQKTKDTEASEKKASAAKVSAAAAASVVSTDLEIARVSVESAKRAVVEATKSCTQQEGCPAATTAIEALKTKEADLKALELKSNLSQTALKAAELNDSVAEFAIRAANRDAKVIVEKDKKQWLCDKAGGTDCVLIGDDVIDDATKKANAKAALGEDLKKQDEAAALVDTAKALKAKTDMEETKLAVAKKEASEKESKAIVEAAVDSQKLKNQQGILARAEERQKIDESKFQLASVTQVTDKKVGDQTLSDQKVQMEKANLFKNNAAVNAAAKTADEAKSKVAELQKEVDNLTLVKEQVDQKKSFANKDLATTEEKESDIKVRKARTEADATISAKLQEQAEVTVVKVSKIRDSISSKDAEAKEKKEVVQKKYTTVAGENADAIAQTAFGKNKHALTSSQLKMREAQSQLDKVRTDDIDLKMETSVSNELKFKAEEQVTEKTAEAAHATIEFNKIVESSQKTTVAKDLFVMLPEMTSLNRTKNEAEAEEEAAKNDLEAREKQGELLVEKRQALDAATAVAIQSVTAYTAKEVDAKSAFKLSLVEKDRKVEAKTDFDDAMKKLDSVTFQKKAIDALYAKANELKDEKAAATKRAGDALNDETNTNSKLLEKINDLSNDVAAAAGFQKKYTDAVLALETNKEKDFKVAERYQELKRKAAATAENLEKAVAKEATDKVEATEATSKETAAAEALAKVKSEKDSAEKKAKAVLNAKMAYQDEITRKTNKLRAHAEDNFKNAAVQKLKIAEKLKAFQKSQETDQKKETKKFGQENIAKTAAADAITASNMYKEKASKDLNIANEKVNKEIVAEKDAKSKVTEDTQNRHISAIKFRAASEDAMSSAGPSKEKIDQATVEKKFLEEKTEKLNLKKESLVTSASKALSDGARPSEAAVAATAAAAALVEKERKKLREITNWVTDQQSPQGQSLEPVEKTKVDQQTQVVASAEQNNKRLEKEEIEDAKKQVATVVKELVEKQTSTEAAVSTNEIKIKELTSQILNTKNMVEEKNSAALEAGAKASAIAKVESNSKNAERVLTISLDVAKKKMEEKKKLVTTEETNIQELTVKVAAAVVKQKKAVAIATSKRNEKETLQKNLEKKENAINGVFEGADKADTAAEVSLKTQLQKIGGTETHLKEQQYNIELAKGKKQIQEAEETERRSQEQAEKQGAVLEAELKEKTDASELKTKGQQVKAKAAAKAALAASSNEGEAKASTLSAEQMIKGSTKDEAAARKKAQLARTSLDVAETERDIKDATVELTGELQALKDAETGLEVANKKDSAAKETEEKANAAKSAADAQLKRAAELAKQDAVREQALKLEIKKEGDVTAAKIKAAEQEVKAAIAEEKSKIVESQIKKAQAKKARKSQLEAGLASQEAAKKKAAEDKKEKQTQAVADAKAMENKDKKGKSELKAKKSSEEKWAKAAIATEEEVASKKDQLRLEQEEKTRTLSDLRAELQSKEKAQKQVCLVNQRDQDAVKALLVMTKRDMEKAKEATLAYTNELKTAETAETVAIASIPVLETAVKASEATARAAEVQATNSKLGEQMSSKEKMISELKNAGLIPLEESKSKNMANMESMKGLMENLSRAALADNSEAERNAKVDLRQKVTQMGVLKDNDVKYDSTSSEINQKISDNEKLRREFLTMINDVNDNKSSTESKLKAARVKLSETSQSEKDLKKEVGKKKGELAESKANIRSKTEQRQAFKTDFKVASQKAAACKASAKEKGIKANMAGKQAGEVEKAVKDESAMEAEQKAQDAEVAAQSDKADREKVKASEANGKENDSKDDVKKAELKKEAVDKNVLKVKMLEKEVGEKVAKTVKEQEAAAATAQRLIENAEAGVKRSTQLRTEEAGEKKQARGIQSEMADKAKEQAQKKDVDAKAAEKKAVERADKAQKAEVDAKEAQTKASLDKEQGDKQQEAAAKKEAASTKAEVQTKKDVAKAVEEEKKCKTEDELKAKTLKKATDDNNKEAISKAEAAAEKGQKDTATAKDKEESIKLKEIAAVEAAEGNTKKEKEAKETLTRLAGTLKESKDKESGAKTLEQQRQAEEDKRTKEREEGYIAEKKLKTQKAIDFEKERAKKKEAETAEKTEQKEVENKANKAKAIAQETRTKVTATARLAEEVSVKDAELASKKHAVEGIEKVKAAEEEKKKRRAEEQKEKDDVAQEKLVKSNCLANQESQKLIAKYTVAVDVPITASQGWINMGNGLGGIRAQLQGNICLLSGVIRLSGDVIPSGSSQGKGFWDGEEFIQLGENEEQTPSTNNTVKWGVIGQVPKECRPSQNKVFTVNNHRQSAKIQVEPSGDIRWLDGGDSHGWISLSGVAYKRNSVLVSGRVGNAKEGEGEISLTNGWHASAGYTVNFYKQNHVCILTGQVKGGRNWEGKIGNLPEACRPKFRQTFLLVQNSDTFRIDVDPSGAIIPVSVTSNFAKIIHLDGIMFSDSEGKKIPLTGNHGWVSSSDHVGYDSSPRATRQGALCILSGSAFNPKIDGKASPQILENSAIVTYLPEWCRPSSREVFSATNNLGMTQRIDVLPNGAVRWMAGSRTGVVGLNGIKIDIASQLVQTYSKALMEIQKCS